MPQRGKKIKTVICVLTSLPVILLHIKLRTTDLEHLTSINFMPETMLHIA